MRGSQAKVRRLEFGSVTRPSGEPRPARVVATGPLQQALRVCVISNPAGGRNARHGQLGAVRDLLRAFPTVRHFEAQTYATLAAAVEGSLDKNADLVVVNGGDGTVQAVLTTLLRSPAPALPLLAVLPGGSTNTTARNVGYSARALPALRRLLTEAEHGIIAGRVEKRPVLRIDADGKSRYAMMFGAGAVYHGIAFAHSRVYTHGVHGQLGATVTLGAFLGLVLSRRNRSELFPPMHAKIGVDGKELEPEPYFGLLASTMDRQFVGIRPYWGTGPGPLRLSLLSYSPRHLLRAFAAVLRGTTNAFLRPEFGYRSYNADDLSLEFDGGFTLDGELFAPPHGPRRVVLSARECAYFLREP